MILTLVVLKGKLLYPITIELWLFPSPLLLLSCRFDIKQGDTDTIPVADLIGLADRDGKKDGKKTRSGSSSISSSGPLPSSSSSAAAAAAAAGPQQDKVQIHTL
jgi:hypothetical protein